MSKIDGDSGMNQQFADLLVFTSAFFAAFIITLDGSVIQLPARALFLWGAVLVTARLTVNSLFGVYRCLWKYVALPDAIAIFRSGLTTTSLLLLAQSLLLRLGFISTMTKLPFGLITIEFCFSLGVSLGVRALWKTAFEYQLEHPTHVPVHRRRRTILYGAGRAGMLLWKELKNHAGVEVIGFVDDDPAKLGSLILGKKVLCNRDSLAKIVHDYRIEDVIVSIATARHTELLPILQRCREIPVSAKIIPSLQEIVEGRVSIAQVREIKAEDVLGRDTIDLGEFDHIVRPAYEGKRILVTGAGGSIGSELVRQLLRQRPASVILLDKDENSIYELEQEILLKDRHAPVIPVVADVRLRERLSAVFADLAPEIIFHAAAHKHVPLMEKNPCEAILNNVIGTEVLLRVCREYGSGRFLFISSDKAVNPTSVMGATKRIGELLVREAAATGAVHAACVRFGNVLNSRGSVVPLFQTQISNGGPITITHPEMVRYFMTIPEAVQLVLCAATLADEGEVFILEIGNPRKILELAHQMISLSGLEAGKDIEVIVTGLRAGEKLVEELIGPDEQLEATQFKKISRVVANGSAMDLPISLQLNSLEQAAQRNNRDEIIRLILRMGLLFPTSRAAVRDPAAVSS